MPRPKIAVVAILGALAALSIGPPASPAQQPPSPGTVGIRLLDAPQARADDPRARLYIVDHLAPGTTINRRVEVSNDAGQTQTIELYAGSATIEGAEFRFGEGREPNDLTRWTRVVPAELSLAPGQRGAATVTIAVPSDASEGERYGVVWAEMRAVTTGQAGVGAVNRVGVRMYLSVGPGGEPATDFEVTDIEGRRDDDGNPVVSAIVRNIGGRAVDLSGDLRLTNGPGGLSAGPVAADLGTTIRPGQTGPVRFTLDPALPNGPWDAEITMRSGTTSRDAQGTVTFPDDAGEVGEGSLTDANRPAIVAGAVVGALLIGWFLFWFFWRRGVSRPTAADPADGRGASPGRSRSRTSWRRGRRPAG